MASNNPYLFWFGANSDRRIKGQAGSGLGDNTAAPVLRNNYNHDARHGVEDDQGKVQLIDVVNQFDWTHTAGDYRYEVPYIRMSELTVNFNSIRQQLKYMLSTGVAGLKQSKWIAEVLTPDGQSAQEWYDEKSKGKNTAQKQKLLSTLEVKQAFDGDNMVGFNDKVVAKHLKPYYGLYGVASTGFEYIFPYFTADGKSVETSWGDMDSSNHGGALSDIIKSTVGPEGFAKSLIDNLAIQGGVIGTHIERAQIYSSQEGPAHTFGFTLFNTGSYKSIVRNWHLQYMLGYQNLPNKLSKVNVDPPVIYEVEIPGYFYSPFAYISSLKISHQGATRTMQIPYFSAHGDSTPSTNMDYRDSVRKLASDTIKAHQTRNPFGLETLGENRKKKAGTSPRSDQAESSEMIEQEIASPKNSEIYDAGLMIIPDAYRIEITIKSMVPESKNLFYHSTLGVGTKASGLYNTTIKNKNKEDDDVEGKARKSKYHSTTLAGQLETSTTNAGAPGVDYVDFGRKSELGNIYMEGGGP